MQLFYSNTVLDTIHYLPEDESKHLIRVLRKKFGDEIHMTDGKGHLFTCKIVDDHPKKAALEVQKKQFFESGLKREIHIAIAPTKGNDRFEWFIEKAVEIGVSSITPIITEHSERFKLKHERALKVTVAAMKQSNRFHLPRVHEVMSLSEFIEQDSSGTKTIAHCEDVRKQFLADLELADQVSLLIGPEGDFSPAEIQSCSAQGYIQVSLGNSRLRTETAGVVGCTLLNL